MSSFPLTNKAARHDGRVTAMLGPTNTGKTYHAIERMLSYQNGCIGFPLRLLARENYDKVCERVGAHRVALVTGEEKIIPRQACYYMCTVEAMPVEQDFDFLGVDEIQLAEDPERGHVFTDRILRARGVHETMFMGSDTMRVILGSLIPDIEFEARERLSDLSYAGYKKLTRLPKRSAIVAFSMDDVYAIAELVRRQRGGTAVVLGALSPRTRNAQVEMYQSGEVDFMVATDAIGMGLNMDIRHVALAASRKFDGAKPRALRPSEIGQIAGRAGRYMKDGTFGVTGRVQSLDEEIVEAVENHRFQSVKAICWRNAALDFSAPKMLLKSLERGADDPMLIRGRASDDYQTLQALLHHEDVMAIASNPEMVRLLWEVCEIPDFRKTLSDTHQSFIAELYKRLSYGPLDEDWVARQVKRLDDVRGDVDTLMTRIAHVRTWTYIAFKSHWLRRHEHWQGVTRQVEDKLSDALHEALMTRFVDRRAAHLMKAMEDGRALLAGVRSNGEVIVESHLIGHLDGFRFIPVDADAGAEYKAVMAAARQALQSEVKRRLMSILNAKDEQFSLSEDGKVLFQEKHGSPLPGQPVGEIKKGDHILKPSVEVAESDLVSGDERQVLIEKLQGWLDGHIANVLEPLAALNNEEGIEGPARGIAFQVREALGILPREDVQDLIDGLDQEGRAALRARRIRLGPILVFIPALNKPAAVRLRAKLWALYHDKPLPVEVPKDGVVSTKIDPKAIDRKFYQAIGYPVYGSRAIRIDMLDRVIVAVYDGAKDGKFQAQHQMAEWLGTPIEDLYEILEAMGHRQIAEETPKEEAQTPDPVILNNSEGSQQQVEGDPSASTFAEAMADRSPQDDKKDIVEIAEKTEDFSPAVRNDKEGEADTEKPEENKKPDLAWFRLKRGKANAKPMKKKPFKVHQGAKSGQDQGERKKGKKANRNPKGKEYKQSMMSSGPKVKPEDSPFAILEQLKKKS